MPNEPEREIEKTLKTYAKERADAADTVLHPATRRLLLDEAAEAYPAGQVIKNTRHWSWYFSWPQLAPAFGIVLLLAMASFFMWPSHPMRNEMKLASNRELSDRANFGDKSKMLIAANRSRNFETVDAPQLSDANKRPVNAPSIVAKDVSARVPSNEGAYKLATAQPQPEPVASVAQSLVSVSPPEINVINAPTYASAPSGTTGFAAPAPNSDRRLSDLTFDLADATQTRDFVSLKSAATKPAKSLRVLRKFRVEQSGNVLRIIDGDGSVYVGNWLPMLAASGKRSDSLTLGKSAGKPLQQSEGVGALTASEVTAESARLAKSEAMAVATIAATNLSLAGTTQTFGGAEPNQFFRVIGTNLSLKQKVIFNGRFEMDLNTLNLGLAAAEKSAPKKTEKAENLKWLTGEISGDATVGSNVFKVLAKPAAGK